MDTKLVLGFLREVMKNNNRPWFQEHKDEYQAARTEFENSVVNITTLFLWDFLVDFVNLMV